MTAENNTGLIYVFTGDGKGKTSAALGTAVRGLANGWTIDWIAFYKEDSWNISEFSLPKMFLKTHRKRFHMHILGCGFFLPENFVIPVPYVQQRQKIGVFMVKYLVHLICFLHPIRGPFPGILDGKGGRDYSHLFDAAFMPGLYEHSRQPGIDGHFGHEFTPIGQQINRLLI